MRKLFATLLLTSVSLPLHAQRSTAPSDQSVPPRLLAASAEKTEKAEKPKAEKATDSRPFLKRLFGPRATPAPVPTATPAPTAKNKPKTKPAPAEMPEEATSKTKPRTNPTASVPQPPVTPSATGGTKSKTGKVTPKKSAPTSTDPAAVDDGVRFKSAKAKALEDAKIAELKSKADSEVDEAAAAKASSAYNRALFEKIREIDPSVSEYATKVEHALARRVGVEKGKE